MPHNGFEMFWQRYPRKVGRLAAQRSWDRLRPPLEAVLTALDWQMQQEQWTRDRGQFIPHPTTWLNQGRWLDEPPQVQERCTETWTQWKRTHLTH